MLFRSPYYSVNFAKEYWDNVFTLFLNEYRAGRTPNPDVLCNREIKFKAFLDYARSLMAVKMATGHFVRTNEQGDLLKGVDPNKEQSYFLYMLKAEQLRQSIFPVGGMTKAEVREKARQAGIPVSEKKDSTGVCFIGERRFKQFLSQYLPAQPGDIVMPDGTVVGRHDGLMYYTLGQRRGLGIPAAHRLYVTQIDPGSNTVTLGSNDDLMKRTLFARRINLITADRIGSPLRCSAKIRYRHRSSPAPSHSQGTTSSGSNLTSRSAPSRRDSPSFSTTVTL